MNQWRIERDRLRAPQENGAALIEPPLEQIAALADANRRLSNQFHYDCGGRSLADLSRSARAELLTAAQQWTSQYRDASSKPPRPEGPIYLTGHQPQMFHPGVWLKNFVLDKAARRYGATAVHLIVDSDVPADAAVRMPTGSAAELHAIQIPFDRAEPKIPYEERRIEDRALFAGFGRRVVEQLAPPAARPLLEQYWPLVQSRAKQTDRLSDCIVQARHQLELSWGLDTLEVRLSDVCVGEAFQWFLAHLLDRLAEFRAVYNETLGEYRRLHRVRSKSHPAADLADDGDWREAPFWIWTADDPIRRRLFARRSAVEITLTDRQSWEARLPLGAEGRANRAVERLMELQRTKVRIRPRAMLTTLWARLALADLFIHGIGGAKYDQITDRLIERFFGRRPPGFMVVSGTLHLPIAASESEQMPGLGDVSAILCELRSLAYHPERCLDATAEAAAALVVEKQKWIETPQTAENARRRCHAIREINAALQPWLEERRSQLAEQLARAMRRSQADQVRQWREYAFCLYPEAVLREFFSRATSQNGRKMF